MEGRMEVKLQMGKRLEEICKTAIFDGKDEGERFKALQSTEVASPMDMVRCLGAGRNIDSATARSKCLDLRLKF